MTGKESRLEIENDDEVKDGKGGVGALGGDEIHVVEGVNIKLVNRGAIPGGSAGKST